MSPDLARDGVALVARALPLDLVERLCAALDDAPQAARIRTRAGLTYGSRNVLEVPEVAALVEAPAFRALVEPTLGPGAFAVRGLLFDKQARANWRVPWHQDLVIAVRGRREVPGFTNWSKKAGVLHVQPPVAVLEGMLAVRLHLDEAGPDTGPLRVLPGSHAHGRLSPDEVRAWAERVEPRTCVTPRGGAALLRPLLLHASGLATRPGRRRVLHLECAAHPLPGGLEWESARGPSVQPWTFQGEDLERLPRSGGSTPVRPSRDA